jgi:hypothetical protein
VSFTPYDSEHDEELVRQAHASIVNANKLRSAFRAVAQNLTGDKKLEVEIRGDIDRSMTDGKKIYLKPTIDFGRTGQHEPSLCDLRDPITEARLCPECYRVDELLAVFYHEVGHITQGTFDKLPERAKARIVADTIRERGMGKDPGSREEKIGKAIEALASDKETGGFSVMPVAHIVSPYLPFLLNALEDARVNRRLYGAMPGLEAMFRASSYKVFTDGTLTIDGDMVRWQDMPVDQQVLIGLYLKASGYTHLLELLHPDAVNALSDPEVEAQLDKLADPKSTVRTTYEVGYPLLEAIRKHGHLRRRGDLEDEPKPEPPPERESSPEGLKKQKGKSAKPDVDTDAEPGEDMPSAPSPEAGESGERERTGDEKLDQPNEKADEKAGDPDAASDGDYEGEDGSGGVWADKDGDEDEKKSPGSGHIESHEDSDRDVSEEGGDDLTGTAGSGDQEADEREGFSGGSAGSRGEKVPSGPSSDVHGRDAMDDLLDDPDALDSGPSDEEILKSLEKLAEAVMGHDADGPSASESADEAKAVERAFAQYGVFDEPSPNISGLNLHAFAPGSDKPGRDLWVFEGVGRDRRAYGREASLDEKHLAPTVARARLTFAENAAIEDTRNLRRGRVDSSRLASVRAGNDKVFMRRSLPNGRDYAVVMGLDVSGSTSSGAIWTTRLMGRAFGRVFDRINVGFELFAHTGKHGTRTYVPNLEIFEIKNADEKWGPVHESRMDKLGVGQMNLDGHTLEFYRKRVEASRADQKIILYVTDGCMPAENYDEELYVLQREIKTCQRLGIHIVGIGVGNDDPKKHGLDTVRIDSQEDLPRLVNEIEKRLK